MGRNPLIDPQPGDLLRRSGESGFLEVRARGPMGVVFGVPGQAASTFVSMDAWRGMALEIVGHVRGQAP